MAMSDIEKFLFYQRYIWSPTDFANFQSWIYGNIDAVAEGAFGAAILSGLRALPGGGMNVTVDPGIAVNSSGRIVVVPTQSTKLLTAPIGNPSKSLIVLRPKLVNNTLIPKPTDIQTLVYLHQKLDYDVVVIPGTPGATPVYPAITAGDVIVAGVKLIAGQTVIARADLDLGIVDRPRKRTSRVSVRSANFAVTGTDEIFEVDGAGGNITAQLPPAGNVEGQTVKFVKIDSSVNELAVSGNLAETISGQNVQTLDTQWQTLSIYSNGISWRVL